MASDESPMFSSYDDRPPFVSPPQAPRRHLTDNPTAYTGSATTPREWSRDPIVSGEVIAVLVLGSLCLLLGAIYGYIYFTRINPRSTRIRKYVEQTTQAEEGAQTTSTHLFLFKKT